MSDQLKKGALLSYASIVTNILLGLVVTPIVIHKLGDSEYGVYTLIGALVGYLAVFDLGLNNAIVRYVALYRSQGKEREQENFIAVVLLIYGAIGVLIALAGVLFYYYLEPLYQDSFTIQEMDLAKKMLIILIINVAITIPAGAFMAICNGYEQFVFPRAARLLRYLLRSALVVGILYMGANALGIVILDTVLNLLLFIWSIAFVRGRLKVRIRLHRFSMLYVRSITTYSIWIFVFAMVYQLQWRSGQVVLGNLFDPVTVAVYGVGVMLGLYYTNFGNVLNGLLLPRAVQSADARLTGIQLTNQTIKTGRLSLAICLFLFGGFLLMGDDFINLWVGHTYSDSWMVALLIMLVYLLPISQGYAHALLEATKKVRFKALAFLFFCLAGLGAGTIAARPYGITGMIVGICAGLFVLQLVMTVYYQKVLRIGNARFFKETYFKIGLPFALLVFCLWWFKDLLEVSWFNLAIQVVFYVLIMGGFMYFVLLNKEEHHKLKSLIKR